MKIVLLVLILVLFINIRFVLHRIEINIEFWGKQIMTVIRYMEEQRRSR